jgi:hypothetical protein
MLLHRRVLTDNNPTELVYALKTFLESSRNVESQSVSPFSQEIRQKDSGINV